MTSPIPGKHLNEEVQYLHKLGATSVATASLLVKPQSKHVPEFLSQKQAPGLCFPMR